MELSQERIHRFERDGNLFFPGGTMKVLIDEMLHLYARMLSRPEARFEARRETI
jgi:hypothetical protein